MEELITQGSVLYTTTTRIHPPDPGKDIVVISSENLSLLKLLVKQVSRDNIQAHYKIVLTRQFMEPDLLNGVPADFLESIESSSFTILMNEADGSARFSIKLPRDGEPVLMNNADYLVPVIGIDCLHQPAKPDTLFRCKPLAKKFEIREGETITPKLAARILMHPNGVCKDWKEGTTIIPFINKVDTPELDSDARTLASHIIHNDNFPVKHVVWGSVRNGRADSI